MSAELCHLDWNATTPLREQAAEAMRRVERDGWGNPASAHSVGRAARRFLEDARDRVAARLGADPSEVAFTSGATESNNLAVFGACDKLPAGSHLLAAEFEHPCIVEPIRTLMKTRGHRWGVLPVGLDGLVPFAAIEAQASDEAAGFMALMMVNHETGAIQPVRRVAKVFGKRLHVHTDAAQAVGKLAVDFHDLGVHTLTASGHKFGGPKGIGVLLTRTGVSLAPRTLGGHQQQGRRPGTESPALAVGFAVAMDASITEFTATIQTLQETRRAFFTLLEHNSGPVFLNGNWDDSIPTTLNLSFPGCRADMLLMKLDLAGIACSTGSACSSGSLTPSTVLQAMSLPDDLLRSALRFSFGASQSKETLLAAASRIAAIVNHTRRALP